MSWGGLRGPALRRWGCSCVIAMIAFMNIVSAVIIYNIGSQRRQRCSRQLYRS